MLKTFILIVSHKSSDLISDQRKHILDNINDDFIFYYFIGDPNLDSAYKIDKDNNIVYLKVEDDYISLSKKVYYAIKFINDNYSDSINGIFKTDDDVFLNFKKLSKCIKENINSKYFGQLCSIPNDQFKTTIRNKYCNVDDITLDKCEYCSGYGYYISKETIPFIIENKESYDISYFEDVCTGIVLNKYGIFPKEVDVKSKGAYISFAMPERHKSYYKWCFCGEIKFIDKYKRCPKCDARY